MKSDTNYNYRDRLFLEILNYISNGVTVEDDIIEILTRDYEMYRMFKNYNIYSLIKNHITKLKDQECIQKKDKWIAITAKGEEFLTEIKARLALKELILAY